jgi:hypothetical protein
VEAHIVRVLSLRSGAAAVAAAAIIFGATTVAQAQVAPTAQTAPADQPASTPAPSVSPPAGGQNPAGGGQPSVPAVRPPARPAPAPTPLSHLPIIDFVVTFTQPGVYNNTPAVQGTAGVNQLVNYDPIDLGGSVRIPVTRKINLFFDRITEGTLNQPLERAYVAIPGTVPGTPCTVAVCVPSYSRATRDVLLQYHGTYTFDRFLTMDVGNSFRHRIFSYGTGLNGAFNTNISSQPFPYTLSSTEHHFSYLGFTYVTKPIKELFRSSFALSETLDVQNVDHHVAVLCSAGNIANGATGCAGKTAAQVGYLDEFPGKDKYYETTQGVTWILPVDVRRGVTFTLNERWGYLNFYENAVSPYRWNSALTYQLAKRFSPGFTLAMRHSDFHASSTQSAPFTSPNSIHVASWDLIGTFRFDTNSLFH